MKGTMNTAKLIAALAALSCDAYAVTAKECTGGIAVSSRTHGTPNSEVYAQLNAAISGVLVTAGYDYHDVGMDENFWICEIWLAPTA